MKTETDAYADYLEDKYLPGRDVYLQRFFYPKIYAELGPGPVLDIGFGAGAFLKFLRAKKRTASGIDSNPRFVERAKAGGFDVALDDMTTLKTASGQLANIVTDNVLEHLTMPQIEAFFKIASNKLAPAGRLICIVPDIKGYEKDPTHQTFVTQELLGPICKANDLTIETYFCYPFNSRAIGKVFYLNMQIMVIGRASK